MRASPSLDMELRWSSLSLMTNLGEHGAQLVGLAMMAPSWTGVTTMELHGR